ncbi:MAG: hypothetical protein ABIQ86_01745 [Steroidobacteraceae bacterium]
MNEDNDLTPFEQRMRTLLRDSVEHLDGSTRSRLARARAVALTQRDTRRSWFDFRYLAPAGAMAAAVLVTVLFVGRHDAAGVNEPAGSALYDLELLADADAYELTQEADLDFIEWAAAMGEKEQAGT